MGVKENKACYIRVRPTTSANCYPIERFYDPEPFVNPNFNIFLISCPVLEHIDQKKINVLDKRINAITTASCAEQLKEWGFNNTTILDWGQKIIFEKDQQSLTIVAVKAITASEETLKSNQKNNTYLIEYVVKNNLYRIHWSGETIRFRWQ